MQSLVTQGNSIMTQNIFRFIKLLSLISAFLIQACSSSNSTSSSPSPGSATVTVNSLEDISNPSADTITLRSALSSATSGQRIIFDERLNGGTIKLSIIGDEHTMLKGEVMGMRDEPSGPVSYLVGYFNRDYGKSALYAKKNVYIDASNLPLGITIEWTGGNTNPARVLAVYGNLTMINVSITGGKSIAEDISTGDPDEQPWTLARGGAVAVWGKARFKDCRIYDNYCEGDFGSSRDRGAFGGGIYADIVKMENCIVSGNAIYGGGAAGGGVFSIGGVDTRDTTSTIVQSSITGNRITGLFAYGGGVYSDGGGIGNSNTLELINATIADNLVNFPYPIPFGYWRGGGVYMSNGSVFIQSCTIVENQVHGVPRTDDLGKKNLAGGIAATIGNAHAVEEMIIGHSIIAGNTVHEFGGTTYDNDIFTGSIFYFKSMGYNRIGVINFDQILVPVGEEEWRSLNRKFYPKYSDVDGIKISDVLDLSSGITRSSDIISAGADTGNPAILYYDPQGSALDQIPIGAHDTTGTYMEYRIDDSVTNDFLEIFLDRLEDYYSLTGFAADFTSDFESFLRSVDLDDDTPGNQPYTDPEDNPILTLADTQWFGPFGTWPKELSNYPYIEFWHRLDRALDAENIAGMGPERISDDVWNDLFSPGPLTENPDIEMITIPSVIFSITTQRVDQLGNQRPANDSADIGAIEIP
jgi:hypothetical protein